MLVNNHMSQNAMAHSSLNLSHDHHSHVNRTTKMQKDMNPDGISRRSREDGRCQDQIVEVFEAKLIQIRGTCKAVTVRRFVPFILSARPSRAD